MKNSLCNTYLTSLILENDGCSTWKIVSVFCHYISLWCHAMEVFIKFLCVSVGQCSGV